MLHPPYTRYSRLYVYHLDIKNIPPVNDPDLIGTWIEDDTAILFFHRPKDELLREICATADCKVTYQADLDYCDWEAGQNISSFTVDDLTIAPAWEMAGADIHIDPSVIFGTGFHPSTRLCLETLLKYLRTPELEINSMLDLGTGTGLLSIVAAHQGVKQITAVDNNPLACSVAIANTERNQVTERVQVKELDLRLACPSTKVDLVVANLYQGLLAELLSTPSFWLAKLYIMAGFIPSMEPNLLAALPAEQTRFLERRRKDRWCLWVLHNRNNL